MADLAADLDDPSLQRACETLWNDVTSTRMYVTGGFGPSASNEGFTSDYDLPNDTAYAETCASVAFIFWAQRMLNLELDGRYADLLERALYNGALSGLSRDGENYFYENKLESDGTPPPLGLAPLPLLHDERLAPRRLDRRLLLLDRPRPRRRPPLRRQRRRARGRRQAGPHHRGEPLPLVRPHPPHRRPRGAAALQPPPAHPRLGERRQRHGQRRPGRRRRVDRARLSRHHPRLVRRATPSSSTCRCPPPASSPTRRCARISAGSPSAAARWSTASSRPTTPTRPSRSSRCRATPRSPPPSAATSSTASSRWWRRAGAASADGWNGDLYRSAPPAAAPATLTAIPYYLWANREPGAMAVWLREG